MQTTSRWPSGVYLLKFVREDNNAVNYTIFTLRDDSRTAPGLFVVPSDTYQAYNEYGGRSLYAFNSCCTNTVSGTPRPVSQRASIAASLAG